MAMKAYLSAISVAIILVAAIVISTGFRSVGIAHGQGNETTGNVTLTPEQKDALIISSMNDSLLSQYFIVVCVCKSMLIS